MLMIYAIPAGLAVAGAAVFTSWVGRRFDAATPPAWTLRRHAREWVSFVVLAVWVGSLLLAGQAFLLLQTGRESLGLFAAGAAIAAVGVVPSLFAMRQPTKRSTRGRN
jgi:hypothetical protein